MTLILTGEVVLHQRRSSYSLPTGGWGLSPPGEIIILPTRGEPFPTGGVLPHRGRPSTPPRGVFPHGGDQSTSPKGVKTRINKNNKQTRTNKQNKNKQEPKIRGDDLVAQRSRESKPGGVILAIHRLIRPITGPSPVYHRFITGLLPVTNEERRARGPTEIPREEGVDWKGHGVVPHRGKTSYFKLKNMDPKR